MDAIIRQTVDHLQKDLLLRNGEQIIRHRTHGIRTLSEIFKLKPDPRKALHVLCEKLLLLHRQVQHNGRGDHLGGKFSRFHSCKRLFIEHALMGGMLVNNV